MLGSQPTLADDSEVFTSASSSTGAGARPNVLFIIDTSGCMDSEVNVYDRTTTYTGVRRRTIVYWGDRQQRRPAGLPATTRKFTLATTIVAALLRRHADQRLVERARTAGQRRLAATAWVDLVAAASTARSSAKATAATTATPSPSSHAAAAPNNYARNGGDRTNRWGNSTRTTRSTGTASRAISFYSANYINWYYGGGEGARKTRLDIVKEVARNMIETPRRA